MSQNLNAYFASCVKNESWVRSLIYIPGLCIHLHPYAHPRAAGAVRPAGHTSWRSFLLREAARDAILHSPCRDTTQ